MSHCQSKHDYFHVSWQGKCCLSRPAEQDGLICFDDTFQFFCPLAVPFFDDEVCFLIAAEIFWTMFLESLYWEVQILTLRGISG